MHGSSCDCWFTSVWSAQSLTDRREPVWQSNKAHIQLTLCPSATLHCSFLHWRRPDCLFICCTTSSGKLMSCDSLPVVHPPGLCQVFFWSLLLLWQLRSGMCSCTRINICSGGVVACYLFDQTLQSFSSEECEVWLTQNKQVPPPKKLHNTIHTTCNDHWDVRAEREGEIIRLLQLVWSSKHGENIPSSGVFECWQNRHEFVHQGIGWCLCFYCSLSLYKHSVQILSCEETRGTVTQRQLKKAE